MRSKRAWMGVSFLVGLRQTFKIEINLIDACETSAAAWHNKHPPICDGAMRTNFVVVFFVCLFNEMKSPSEAWKWCQKMLDLPKVKKLAFTKQPIENPENKDRFDAVAHQCTNATRTPFLARNSCSMDFVSHPLWSIWYTHCTNFVCFSVCCDYFMTMAYDDLLIVTIFYSLRPFSIRSQSMCKCLEFTLPTTVSSENICKAQCCSRAVMHFW